MPERLYENADELETKCNEYFDLCEEKEKYPGFSGLAYYLGFCRRQTLNDYANRDDEASVPIKRSMLRIEAHYESRLNCQSCTGAIFALKNRGWVDGPDNPTESIVAALKKMENELLGESNE